MNIHEYQGKQLLKGYGAAGCRGRRRSSRPSEAEAAAKALPGPLYVVKSQIHAGGRGKGKFKELGPDAKGGVRLAKSVDEVVANVKEMLGNTLVTKQTGPAGKQVNRLYIEDGADIDRELYLLDPGRPLGRPRRLRRLDRRRHGHRGRRARHAGEDHHRRDRPGKGRDRRRREGAQRGAEARRRCGRRTARRFSRRSTRPSSRRT